jgi:hypothetical protein
MHTHKQKNDKTAGNEHEPHENSVSFELGLTIIAEC